MLVDLITRYEEEHQGRVTQRKLAIDGRLH